MPVPFQIEIHQPDGATATYELAPGNYTVGRGDSCRIRLRHALVSERHALLALQNDGAWVEDLGSSNGTYVGDAAVDRRQPLPLGAELRIGAYSLRLLSGPVAAATAAGPDAVTPSVAAAAAAAAIPPDTAPIEPPPLPDAPATPPDLPPPLPARPSRVAPAAAPAGRDPLLSVRREIRNQIHRELVQRLDLKRLTAERISSEELQRRAREAIDLIVRDVRRKLPPGIEPDRLATEIFNEALRLGPLEEFLADDTITEIMVNGPHQVYIEREGRLYLTGQDFMDDSSVLAIIERIVAPLGRRIDESQPYVDARLPDGSRVNAVIAPLSLTGPCVTIRKFSRRPLEDTDLVRLGTLTPEISTFLRVCVQARRNVVVSGGTGSGKTTLLNVLSAFIPETERIITIEDAAELRLVQPHLVRLEARPPNIEGRGAIAIRDLVRNALRMRPDRIIVGECRGGEALDMLQAMNTGHDGSLTTIHANAPRDVISRLETMVLMSGLDLPSRAIREQIASAVDLIVHESRFSDGSRKITSVTEIVGLEGNQIVMQDIFEHRQTGIGEGGRVQGQFRATGAVPTFFEELKPRGLDLDPSIFQPPAREPAGGRG
jgi:pilus assembly protein CpaF